MRYKILSNWLGISNGMCYYLMDTIQKANFTQNYPESTGHKLISWSFNGKEIYDLCSSINESVDKV